MSAVGLIYVEIVLIVNGVMLLGWLTPREAAPLNLFVGALQVFTPTYLIVVAADNVDAVFAASGIYPLRFHLSMGGNQRRQGLQQPRLRLVCPPGSPVRGRLRGREFRACR